jgi:hypothetical protein
MEYNMSDQLSIKEFAELKGCTASSIYKALHDRPNCLSITDGVCMGANGGGRAFRTMIVLDDRADKFKPIRTVNPSRRNSSSIWNSITKGKW